MLVLQKILLGVTLAAPIGPVSIEMIKRGLSSGFWSAFNIRIGGAIGNFLCLSAAFIGLSALQSHPILMLVIGLIGSKVLLYMGVTNLLKGLKPIVVLDKVQSHLEHPLAPEKRNKELFQSLVLGFVLAVFNPIGVMFWLSVFANDLPSNESLTPHHFWINTFIIGGVLMWGATLSGALAFGRRFITPTVMRAITVGSGCILIYFGLKFGIPHLKSFYALLFHS